MSKNVRNSVDALMTQPAQEITRWARMARFQMRLWRYCWRRLREHNVTAMSAALSFRTIFAMIPVLVFAFLVLRFVGVIDDSKQSLQHFMEVSGLTQVVVAGDTQQDAPSSTGGDSVNPPPSDDDAGHTSADDEVEVFSLADMIESVFANVEQKLTLTRLGPIGGALLIWTAITLLTTMEHSLNRIFGAPRGRSIPKRILLYWSVLTLGPVALSAAAFAGETIAKKFTGLPGIGWLLVTVGKVGPAIVGVLVIAAIYKLLPNTRVRYRAAISGGVIAVPLWLLARWGFAAYVQQLVVKGNLYGVLGVLPLFLIWVNLSWLIFLFGAELAHTATNLNRMALREKADRTWLGAADMFAVAVAAARHFESGDGAIELDQIAETVDLPAELTERLVNRLIEARVLCPVDGDRDAYVLARPADAIDACDILRAADPRAFDGETAADAQVSAAVGAIEQNVKAALSGSTLGDAARSAMNPPRIKRA